MNRFLLPIVSDADLDPRAPQSQKPAMAFWPNQDVNGFIGAAPLFLFLPAGGRDRWRWQLRAAHLANAPRLRCRDRHRYLFFGSLWVVALSADYSCLGVLQQVDGRLGGERGGGPPRLRSTCSGLPILWFGGAVNFPNWRWVLWSVSSAWFCGTRRQPGRRRSCQHGDARASGLNLAGVFRVAATILSIYGKIWFSGIGNDGLPDGAQPSCAPGMKSRSGPTRLEKAPQTGGPEEKGRLLRYAAWEVAGADCVFPASAIRHGGRSFSGPVVHRGARAGTIVAPTPPPQSKRRAVRLVKSLKLRHGVARCALQGPPRANGGTPLPLWSAATRRFSRRSSPTWSDGQAALLLRWTGHGAAGRTDAEPDSRNLMMAFNEGMVLAAKGGVDPN